MLEAFEFFEAADVGLCGVYRRIFCGEIADRVIYFLFGDAVGLDELLIASRSNFGQIGIGLCSGEIGFSLRKLLIYFRSINVSKQIALRNASADVVIPLFDVAAGPGVDRRFDVSLHGA